MGVDFKVAGICFSHRQADALPRSSLTCCLQGAYLLAWQKDVRTSSTRPQRLHARVGAFASRRRKRSEETKMADSVIYLRHANAEFEALTAGRGQHGGAAGRRSAATSSAASSDDCVASIQGGGRRRLPRARCPRCCSR